MTSLIPNDEHGSVSRQPSGNGTWVVESDESWNH